MNHRNAISRVQLISPHSPEYRLFLQKILENRTSRGGQRNAGEMIGRLAERAVRHWLYQQVPLDSNRILAWQEHERAGLRYQELDAVQCVDHEALCLFEIKLAAPKAMERGIGLGQLNSAVNVLLEGRRCRRVCRRLVYIADAPLPVGRDEGIRRVNPDDTQTDLGVVWVSPSAVTAAAAALDLSLPQDWFDPSVRSGPAPSASPEDAFSCRAADAVTPFNPVAAAMERALARQVAA